MCTYVSCDGRWSTRPARGGAGRVSVVGARATEVPARDQTTTQALCRFRKCTASFYILHYLLHITNTNNTLKRVNIIYCQRHY